MIEDSIEEFLTTTPGMESTSAIQETMMVPHGRWHRGWKPASLMSDVTLIMEGSRRKLLLDNPSPSKRQRHREASSLPSEPLSRLNRKRRRGASPHMRWRGS
jgi:hypothetical protein